MSKELTFIDASSFPGGLEALAALYTETFQEYYSEGALQPVLITADDLAGYVVEEQIDLDASPVMLVDGEPAGLVTIGLRAHGEAYCRGFGIVPAFRGDKLGVPLANEMVRDLATCRLYCAGTTL